MTCTIYVVGALAFEETIVIAYTIIFKSLTTRGTLLNRFLRLFHRGSLERDGNVSAESAEYKTGTSKLIVKSLTFE